MNKTIITTSVLALFAGASWAIENNVVFENKTIVISGITAKIKAKIVQFSIPKTTKKIVAKTIVKICPKQ